MEIEKFLINDLDMFIEQLLVKALVFSASDIHIDPNFNSVSVKLRVGGNIIQIGYYDNLKHEIFVGRIKVMSGLRSDIHNKAQDGRFYSNVQGERVDVRVSIMPTFYGENCVMRILRPGTNRAKSFKELGMLDSQVLLFKKSLTKSSGLIIIAGPTGSGKTSTLYTTLEYLKSINDLKGKNIITIEDPIESSIESIRQIQVMSDKDFTFKDALKGILRQDPDIIMLGEIRDKETASIAMQTAMTGHLVLTTIHAHNASSVIPRLIDIGIDPYLISSTVNTIVSQRLIREFDFKEGLYGQRRGVFEIMNINNEIRKMINEKCTSQQIDQYLIDNNNLLIKDTCNFMYTRHITTKEELSKIINIYE